MLIRRWTGWPARGGQKKSEETIRFPARFHKVFTSRIYLLILQIYSICFAVSALFQLVRNLLAFFQSVHTGRLNGSDVMLPTSCIVTVCTITYAVFHAI